jgi:hypothetical protein
MSLAERRTGGTAAAVLGDAEAAAGEWVSNAGQQIGRGREPAVLQGEGIGYYRHPVH